MPPVPKLSSSFMQVVHEKNLKAHLTVLASYLHSEHLIVNSTSFSQVNTYESVRLKNNVIPAHMPPS